MFVLDNGDKLRGSASVASVVDYTFHGLAGDTLSQLANGQLADTVGDLYMASAIVVVTSMMLVNIHSASVTLNLFLLPSGGTARRILAKDFTLSVGYSLHYDGSKVFILSPTGALVSSYVAHATSHVNGEDDIQNATAGQKGLATAAQITKLDGIETAADVTDVGNVASVIHGATEKTLPVDADEVGLIDSAAANVLKRLTWANIKATLKTYFDVLYNLYNHPNHTGAVTSIGDGATAITDKAVTLAKMDDMATASLLGRNTAGVGVPEVLSKTTAQSLLNVEDGSKDDQTGAEIKTAYEGEADTNAYTDNEKTKLSGIATGADVTGNNVPQAHAASHTNGTDDIQDATNAMKGLATAAQITKLEGIETLADVTDAINVGSSIHGVTGKTTPVDADEVGLIDSAASNVLKKLTWSNIKAALKTYFDTFYGSLSNLVEDTTPQLGGDLEYNEHNQIFKTTLANDDKASGDIIEVTFGESVVFGKLCYPDSTTNEWMLALGTNAAVKHPTMGIALETKGDGETGKLLLRGLIRDATYFSAFSLGDKLYLSDGTAGSWVNARPSDSGDIVQMVGWVLAANYAYFCPDYTYVEIS